ncbi:unnamed protein product [Caenorhabditis brenneri]
MAPQYAIHWITDPDYIDFLNYLVKRTESVESPMCINRLVRDFKDKSGAGQAYGSLRQRIFDVRKRIHSFPHINKKAKVKLLFALSASVDAVFLKELKKDALVKVDEKLRIAHYKSNDGSLELRGDQSRSARMKIRSETTKFESKQRFRSWVYSYFKNKNDSNAVPKNEQEKEMGNLIEFITEKCENADSPLRIHRLRYDFNNHFGLSRSFYCINERVKRYCNEIQNIELMDTHSKVRQLFCLSEKLSLEHLEKLRKTAVVEVDQENRIIKYISNDGSLTLQGSHWGSKKIKPKRVEKRNKINAVEISDNSEGESDHEGLDDSSDEYSSEEFDSEFDSDEENDETKGLPEPSNETDHFDNKNPVGNSSSAEIPIGDNFDFDPPTERSHRSEETEMRKDDSEITENTAVKTQRSVTLPKSKISVSSSHTPKTPKRKADESAESSSSKRIKPLPEESMNPEEMNDNFSHDDPPRVELKPFRGLLGLPKGTEKDAGIQQIPKPHPQVEEAPIKKEYEEEAQTLLKTVFKSFKSLILGLDTTGLSQLQMELDTKIETTGRGIEVSNKEVIMAMELLVVKLSKHGALKSSEEAISLREVLLMLRMIILNSSFNGLENILKMLKENIDQFKNLDKKVPVSKVDSVLRATIESIST